MTVRLAWAFLTAFALILVPLGMVGDDGRAVAHGGITSARTADHCSGKVPGKQDKQDQDDFETACANACAACIAALPGSEAQLEQLANAADPVLLSRLSGAPPERETPPPRLAPEL